MSKRTSLDAAPGVSQFLARQRSAKILAVRYTLSLEIPEAPDEPIRGSVVIALSLSEESDWPPIDFRADSGHANDGVRDVSLDGSPVEFAVENGHIHLSSGKPAGQHEIRIDFQAGTLGLTRRTDLVYTLFVPARAHRVFPCFDQPDLKAQLDLSLRIPEAWDAIANAPILAETLDRGGRRVTFARTEKLPTYLFAFAAGRLSIEARVANGHEIITAYVASHRPRPEPALQEILRLKSAAVSFLERYTGIEYPFAQLGIVLIPEFEFMGMEHPGAVFYRESALLLSETASPADELRRAGLIAHETAHLWYGDLATMPWFDDVWLKEACANFLADKFVAHAFPEHDDALGFVLRHFPPAYAIDRTQGTHAIRQVLENLDQAGNLYDALIYHKTPIAMRALESAVGKDAMRAGLGRYVSDFRFSNGDWHALRQCIEHEAESDLTTFSERWIESSGMHALPQSFDAHEPLAYGTYRLSEPDRIRALELVRSSHDALAAAKSWIVLFEDMLAGETEPAVLMTAAIDRVAVENNALLLARVCQDLYEIFWRFLDPGKRAIIADPLERILQARLQTAIVSGEDAKAQHFWLRTLSQIACTDGALAELEACLRMERTGLAQVPDELAMCITLNIALQRPQRAGELMKTLRQRLDDTHRQARLEILAACVSDDRRVRDQQFQRLRAPDVDPGLAIDGLRLLNHAIREAETRHHLGPGIDHAAALHARGDIFFPEKWLNALFHGHGTQEACDIIQAARSRTDHDPRFDSLLARAADPVERASTIRARSACR